MLALIPGCRPMRPTAKHGEIYRAAARPEHLKFISTDHALMTSDPAFVDNVLHRLHE